MFFRRKNSLLSLQYFAAMEAHNAPGKTSYRSGTITLRHCNRKATAGPSTPLRSAQDDSSYGHWTREPRLARVVGFGPLFDEETYEADGHIRIDFGSDTPFLEEDLELDSVAARHVEENVRQLVELTAAVEKASGATARILWSELGESLAERLAARLSTLVGGAN